MIIRDPEKNFELLWKTFYDRYQWLGVLFVVPSSYPTGKRGYFEPVRNLKGALAKLVT